MNLVSYRAALPRYKFGGDGGNRTRVRKTLLLPFYKLSLLQSHRRGSDMSLGRGSDMSLGGFGAMFRELPPSLYRQGYVLFCACATLSCR